MKKNELPKVIFTLPSIAQEARTLKSFCAPRATGWDWSHVVYNRHPELKEKLADLTDQKKIYTACYAYAKWYRKEHAKDFKKALAQHRQKWEPIEKEFLQTLCEHFETKYPAKRKLIRGYVSMVPIYPRSIEGWYFNVSYFVPGRVLEIACHEIVHFLYFKKWFEVFPDTKKEEVNSPHLVWRLSEILAPVFLNEHPTFKKYFDRKQNTYKEFQKIRIEGKQPMTVFSQLYRKHLKSKDPFEEYLQVCWVVAKKHEKVLMGV